MIRKMLVPWYARGLGPEPAPPLHRARKLATVRGTVLPKRPMMIRPAGCPAMLISKNVCKAVCGAERGWCEAVRAGQGWVGAGGRTGQGWVRSGQVGGLGRAVFLGGQGRAGCVGQGRIGQRQEQDTAGHVACICTSA